MGGSTWEGMGVKLHAAGVLSKRSLSSHDGAQGGDGLERCERCHSSSG